VEKGNRNFSDRRFYPVFFMIIISIFFIGLLATFYYFTYEKIENYRITNKKRDILDLFSIPISDLNSDFDDYIKEKRVNDQVYYIATRDSVILGYCYEINGEGLWGTIKALLVFDPEFKSLQGLEILEQNETPGLGGRITEKWFKDQFKDRDLVKNNKIISLQLVPEGEDNTGNKINQITGATSSSRAVVRLIDKEFAKIVQQRDLNYD